MKKYLFSIIVLFAAYSCSSDSEPYSYADGASKVWTYSKSGNIIYANTKAETSFINEGKLIELSNGIRIKQINDSVFLYDSDMLLTKQQVEELEKYNEINPESKTKGTIDKKARAWPNGKVYYSFNSNVTDDYKKIIEKGIEEWRKQSKLEFIKRTSQNDYIEFILGRNGSYSKVGCMGGMQYLYLDERWANSGTVMHEVGHAVGLIHEHQAWIFHDTNIKSKLIFKWDNIKDDWKDQFIKSSREHAMFTDGLYDENYPINSLMIYGSYSSSELAINSSKPVMTFCPFPNLQFAPEYTFSAQRSYLSVSDRIAVANKYGYSYSPQTDLNRPPI